MIFIEFTFFSHRIWFFKVNMKAFCSRYKQYLELFYAFHVNIYHVIFENITWWYENVCGNTYRFYKIYSTAFCLSLYIQLKHVFRSMKYFLSYLLFRLIYSAGETRQAKSNATNWILTMLFIAFSNPPISMISFCDRLIALH